MKSGHSKYDTKTIVSILFVLAFLISCSSSDSEYDNGYEDGYDGAEEKTSIFGQEEYQAGYEDGAFDSDCDYWKKQDYKEYLKYCK